VRRPRSAAKRSAVARGEADRDAGRAVNAAAYGSPENGAVVYTDETLTVGNTGGGHAKVATHCWINLTTPDGQTQRYDGFVSIGACSKYITIAPPLVPGTYSWSWQWSSPAAGIWRTGSRSHSR
jgi:hypothetical protein